MKFIDEAVVQVLAGHGGAGRKSFRREKYVPFGGPDGGDGGKGGSVILQAELSVHTLLDLTFSPRLLAENGQPGGGKLKAGKDGKDLIVKLPVGTVVYSAAAGKERIAITDLDHPGKSFVLCKGGRGGKGNAFFKSATNQAPQHCQPGEDGEQGEFLFSLKLVADVGLIGFPNAGKSTLISVVSAARPKIADYPFTTLSPQLGTVRIGPSKSFVVADIPGLIPDAHLGKGLGISFLKHIERTKVLAHLIDPTQLDEAGERIPVFAQYQTIRKELEAFSSVLLKKTEIIALTKADLLSADELDTIVRALKKRKISVHPISSATHRGIDDFVKMLWKSIRLSDKEE